MKHPYHNNTHDWRTLLLLLGASLCVWIIAYQQPFYAHIFIGGDPTTHRRGYDAPFLQGFNASEPDDPIDYRWWTLDPGYAYRWTTSNATISLPGVGWHRWVVSLLAVSGRPSGQPATSAWATGIYNFPALNISATPRTYHILADSTHAGDLSLGMHTPPYVSPGDPRDLGFVLRGVRIAPTNTPFYLPALAQLGWLCVLLILIFFICRWSRLSTRLTFVLTLLWSVAMAWMLATHRFSLTLFTPILTTVILTGWLIGMALWHTIGKTILRLSPTRSSHNVLMHESHIKLVLALVMLAFVLRLGGMLHPYARFSDHRLHANNVLDVSLGRLYFTEGLPREAGGGQSPYPPGSYLLVAPAQLVAPTTMDGRVLVVQSSIALFDSLIILVLWFLLLQAGVRQPTALAGSVLYLAPAPILASFSIGEYANLGGQVLIFPLIMFMVLFPYATHQSLTRWNWLVFTIALSIGLLGHMGITLSVILFLVAWWLIALGIALNVNRHNTEACISSTLLQNITVYGLLAAGFVGVFYYSAPLFVDIFAQRLTGTATSTLPASPLVERLQAIGRGIFSDYSKLHPVLIASGCGGVVLVWQRSKLLVTHLRAQILSSLSLVLAAWWLGTLFSFGLLLVARQGVRWQHFIYPALCLGTAPLLVAYARRGNIGRLVAVTCLIVPIWYGITVWIHQISTYMH